MSFPSSRKPLHVQGLAEGRRPDGSARYVAPPSLNAQAIKTGRVMRDLRSLRDAADGLRSCTGSRDVVQGEERRTHGGLAVVSQNTSTPR